MLGILYPPPKSPYGLPAVCPMSTVSSVSQTARFTWIGSRTGDCPALPSRSHSGRS